MSDSNKTEHDLTEAALYYHENPKPGKLEIQPTKPLGNQRDLALAYSPGVAAPCLAIADDPSKAAIYTSRANLVAVTSNGTAVLGLGHIGPLASKPVMEGKAVLFKKFAGIDVFDIEVDELDVDKFVDAVSVLEPTFGGINLEDIKAPECFMVEAKLREKMKIPVFHDDQHGTAIIVGAAVRNGLHLAGKKIEDAKIVASGAGAAALACLNMLVSLGAKRENIWITDIEGVVYEGREKLMDEWKSVFAQKTDLRTLEEVIDGADVFLGLSVGGVLKPQMVEKMGKGPLILALANPNPEIMPEEALAVRDDVVMCTGRSDYPNQVNNVLGFPYLFRGALDVQATHINEEMKIAAARALARLAREGVTDDVLQAYGTESIKFGPNYIIPKPMDARSLSWVAPAVAEAAIKSGVAQETVDIRAYRHELIRKLSPTRRVMWHVTGVAKKDPRRVVFPEGEQDAILRAADIVQSDNIAMPVLIGRPQIIEERAATLGVDLTGVEIVDRDALPHMDRYTDLLWKRRQRRGLTHVRARRKLERSRTHYAMAMLASGDVDGLVSGLTSPYPDTIRPALQIIGTAEGVNRACGCYMVITKKGVRFLADATVNIDPGAETLAESAILTADLARELGVTPRVAMLSFSNFGDAPHPAQAKVARAVEMVRATRPDIEVDGEMQADVALLEEARKPYPFIRLTGPANVLVFPNLGAGNIAYKLLASTGHQVIGPLVLGMAQPVNVLQQGASVSTIVHMTSLTVARAHRLAAE